MSGKVLPNVVVGWQYAAPGFETESDLVNEVPYDPDPVQLLVQYEQWRAQVLAAREQRRAAAYEWFPLLRPDGQHVTPFLGGTARGWRNAVLAMAHSFYNSGGDAMRIADLTQTGVVDQLQADLSSTGAPWATQRLRVSERGSSFDVLSGVSDEALLNLVGDVCRVTPDRQGMLDAAATRAALSGVADCLAKPVTVERLLGALEMVLTGFGSTTWTSVEDQRLHEFHRMRLLPRVDLQQTLGRVEHILSEVARFGRTSGTGGVETIGQGQVFTRLLGVEAGGGTLGFELGRDLAARFVTAAFRRPTPGRSEMLVVLGADVLGEDVVTSMESAATQNGQQLVLFYERLCGAGERQLARAGSHLVVFMALPHPDDAELASRFLGREYKFVVSGRSIAEGTSRDFSSSHTVSSDSTTSRAHDFSSWFATTVTRGFSQGSSTTTSAGTGISRTATSNTQRVHEYVIEPTVFQTLPESTLLAVQARDVKLGQCDPAIRKLPTTAHHLVLLP